MMRPQMVIISENTLNAMALRSLLAEIAKGLDVVCYSSLEEYQRAEAEGVPHFFVSADVVFRNSEFFREYVRRTVVITDGEAASFVQSGFKTIDVRWSEQAIAREILSIHSVGHPRGYQANHPMGGHPHAVAVQTQLSQREQEVLALMVKGYINKEIADRLNISLATVIFHRNNISEKLQTRSIGRLTIYAVLNGIVSLSEI